MVFIERVIFLHQVKMAACENDLRFIDPLENNGRPIKLIDFYSAKRLQLILYTALLCNYCVGTVPRITF